MKLLIEISNFHIYIPFKSENIVKRLKLKFKIN